ncbi:hypothetical protein [Streptomyces sp. S.PB5]|uniref:hypothetical protein n=1 Tax=Streptomyces sp. S.PB5 TaxID=3020844 RepID=UPI0025B246C8|nr:hypothetical protein [Streptomyces sp. S.PB5]MDN3021591.1 hypothetical protein [Streptomyces sp. S.PB5]
MASEMAVSPNGGVHQVRTVLLDTVTGTVSVDDHGRTRLPAPARWSQLSDVLIESGTEPARADAMALIHPGVLVTAAYQGSRCRLRIGPARTVCELTASGVGRPADVWGAVASLAHAWLVAGLPAEEFGSTPLRLLRGQASSSPLRAWWSRRRTDSASGDWDLPTDE